MIRRPHFWLVFSLLLTGCNHWQRAAWELDQVAKYVEEWGTVSVSEPLIIENKGQFAIKYDRPVAEYINAARTGVQGAALRSVQESLDIQTGVRVKADLSQLLAALQAAKPAQAGPLQTLGSQLVQGAVSVATLQDVYDETGVLVPPEEMPDDQAARYRLIGKILQRAAQAGAAGPEVAVAVAAADAAQQATGSAEPSVQGAGPDTDAALQEQKDDSEAPAPTAPAEPSVLPAQRPAQAALTSTTFSPALPIGPLPSSISENDALIQGVVTKINENILKYMVNPGVGIGDNYAVYLAVLQVSARPGWRTRSGYFADVSVGFHYARVDEPRMKEPAIAGSKLQAPLYSSRRETGSTQPFVVSVFPLLEAQTLDLRYSARDQIAIATKLAGELEGLGLDAAAQQLTDYVKRNEYDLATRSSIPVVAAYTDGTHFGYQVRPAAQALGDPASSEGKPGSVLHPKSFPALVLLVCNKKELEQWSHFEIMVSARWIPNSRWRTRSGEAKRVRIAKRLDDALSALGDFAASNPTQSHLAQELLRRYNLYEVVGTGVTRYSAVPSKAPSTAASPPVVAGVKPDRGFMDGATMLAIKGDHFSHKGKSIVKSVTVGGVACDFVVTGKTTLVAEVPAYAFDANDGAQEVIVTTTKGIAAGGGVTFDRQYKNPTVTAPAISVQRGATGRVTRISVNEDALSATKADQLIGAIREILEHENCCDNVEVQVSTDSSVKSGN